MSHRFLFNFLLALILNIFIFSQSYANQMEFDAYRMLNIGMTEKEVVSKAGSPDKEIYFVNKYFSPNLSRQMLYILSPKDSFDPHLTIISIEKGIIFNIERIPVSTQVDSGCTSSCEYLLRFSNYSHESVKVRIQLDFNVKPSSKSNATEGIKKGKLDQEEQQFIDQIKSQNDLKDIVKIEKGVFDMLVNEGALRALIDDSRVKSIQVPVARPN